MSEPVLGLNSKKAPFIYMAGYLRVGNIKVMGAPVYVHSGVLIFAAIMLLLAIRSPVNALVAVVLYFSVITIHELGHALVARKFDCEVYSLRIGVFHGLCEYEEPYYEREDVFIAWGGVMAQLAVAIPVLLLAVYTPIAEYEWFLPIGSILGYYNLVIAVVNILPFKGLDGEKAWRIFRTGFRSD